MLEIDTKTYKLKKINFYPEEFKKKRIILGGSLRKSNYHLVHYLNYYDKNAKLLNSFTISRTGKVYQHFEPKYYTDFLSNKEVDKYSIYILLENMDALYFYNEKNPEESEPNSNFKYSGNYYNILNEKYDYEQDVYHKNWQGYDFWEKYSKEQMISLSLLCKKLCTEFDIKCESIGFNFYNKNSLGFGGIISRSNIIESCTDLNPSFNFEKFQENLLTY